MDYQAYAYLQTAKDGRCPANDRRGTGRLSDGWIPMRLTWPPPVVAGVYAAAAIPARYALERGAWAEAASLAGTQGARFPTLTRSRTSRARSAPRVQEIPRRPRADVEQLAAIRDTPENDEVMPTGRSRSTSSGRSRSRGSHSRKATNREAIQLLRAAAATPKTPPTNQPSRRVPSRQRASCWATGCPVGSRAPRRGAGRIRSHYQEGTEPLPRFIWWERAPQRQPASALVRSRSTNNCYR